MRARSRIPRCSALALCAAALFGCGGGSDAGSATPTPRVSEAEKQLGVALLPPGDSALSIGTLTADELPPDASLGHPVDAADMPPAT